MVSSEQQKLLQSTIATMRGNGKDMMAKFYKNLFKDHPEFRNFFNETNQSSGRQPEAFAETIFRFVESLDNLDAIKPQMKRLSSKHRAVGVTPDQYPVVNKYLLQVIKESLGDKATPEVVAAWEAVLDLMAQTFIKREKELYAQLGDDKGFVPFSVAKKEQIASGPTYTFTLSRQDGKKVWPHNGGQYITIRVEKDGVRHQGHYVPVEPCDGNSYVVTCRQGHDDQNSIVSEEIIRNRAVGSTVLVSAPAGSFGLVKDAKNSLFISGGIGITFLMGLVNELNKQGQSSSVSVVQCAQSEDRAAFADKLRNMLPKGQYLLLTKEQQISKSHLQDKLKPDTQVYISGSETFLSVVDRVLNELGHPRSKVQIKSVEPTLGLLKALDSKK